MRLLIATLTIQMSSMLIGCTSSVSDASPQSVIDAYRAADTVEERYEHVVQGTDTLARMTKAYANVDLIELSKVVSAESFGEPREFTYNGIAAVEIPFENGAPYFLFKGKDGWKIYWEAMAYNEVNAMAFQVKFEKSKTTRWMFHAKLADYYNYEYLRARESHYSFELADPRTRDPFTGYIERSSEDGEALFDLLSDGQWHSVTVDIKYNDSAKSGTVVSIEKFVSDNWLGEPDVEQLKRGLGLSSAQ